MVERSLQLNVYTNVHIKQKIYLFGFRSLANQTSKREKLKGKKKIINYLYTKKNEKVKYETLYLLKYPC